MSDPVAPLAANTYVACFTATTDQVNEFYKVFVKSGVHGRVKSIGHFDHPDHDGVCNRMREESTRWQRN